MSIGSDSSLSANDEQQLKMYNRAFYIELIERSASLCVINFKNANVYKLRHLFESNLNVLAVLLNSRLQWFLSEMYARKIS